MSEIKVNSINPSSGTTVDTTAQRFIVGHSGQNSTLVVSTSSGTLPAIDANMRIWTTDGTVQSTYGYKIDSGLGLSEYLGSLTNHGLGLLTSNQTRLFINDSGNSTIGSNAGSVTSTESLLVTDTLRIGSEDSRPTNVKFQTVGAHRNSMRTFMGVSGGGGVSTPIAPRDYALMGLANTVYRNVLRITDNNSPTGSKGPCVIALPVGAGGSSLDGQNPRYNLFLEIRIKGQQSFAQGQVGTQNDIGSGAWECIISGHLNTVSASGYNHPKWQQGSVVFVGPVPFRLVQVGYVTNSATASPIYGRGRAVIILGDNAQRIDYPDWRIDYISTNYGGLDDIDDTIAYFASSLYDSTQVGVTPGIGTVTGKGAAIYPESLTTLIPSFRVEPNSRDVEVHKGQIWLEYPYSLSSGGGAITIKTDPTWSAWARGINWSLGGATGQFPGGGTASAGIGVYGSNGLTADYIYLGFAPSPWTNTSAVLSVNKNGRVGIGSITPEAELAVHGADGTLQGLFVNQNGTDVDTLAGTLSQMWTRAPVHLKMAGTSTTRLLLGGFTGGAAGIQSSNANGAGSLPLVIQPFGGSVGIGASAGSSSSLMINSSSAINGAANRGGLVITNPSNTRQIQFGINDTSNVAWIEGWVPGTGGSALCLNPTSGGGSVGIGTTGPTALLHVQGTFYVSGGATFGASTTFTTTANANATPTAGTHIANKDYVDNRYRVGATVVITGTNNLTGTATNVPANWSVSQSSTTFSITIPTAATNSTTGGGTWYGSLITRGAAGVCDMWPVSVVGNGTAVSTTVTNTTAQGFTLILIRTA